MSQPIASSSTTRQVPFPPPQPAIVPNQSKPIDPYDTLSFEPASQAQILRAHQRDSSQIHRLIELASELIRSFAGTRWLAHKQMIVDLAVKTVYLLLTFGRGSQTLGEEYTDILPYAHKLRRTPSRSRRLLTILFILLPSILTSPSIISYLRSSPSDSNDERPSVRRKIFIRIAQFLESPIGQALPEIHMAAFLLKGRFFELGRRLTGVSYISTLPSRPPEARAPSYEPLALLMALPILYRLFPQSHPSSVSDPTSNHTQLSSALRSLEPESHLPIIPRQSSPLNSLQKDSLVSSGPEEYDESNTYLTPEAQLLPSRQCTLCLEPRGTGSGSGGTVGVTECGHIFCWGCLGGLDKMECPLCRQTLRMERLVAAYNL